MSFSRRTMKRTDYFYRDHIKERTKVHGGARMNIIAVCGMPGCGKGEFAEIAKEMGSPVYSMGDVVRFYFKENFPGRDLIETGIYADMERKKYGQDVWARRLIEMVEAKLEPGDDLLLIDGLRSKQEKELFGSRWGTNFRVLAIHSSPETRFMRIKARGRGDDTLDRKVFDQRDARELGWGLGEVIALADIIAVNEGGLDDFRSSVKGLLQNEVAGR
ncbi:MAG: AAA family ATPase [Thermoplasmatota archaeon]